MKKSGRLMAESPEAEADAYGKAAVKRAKGGKVDGNEPRHRLDRRARGGKVNGKGTKINIIVAPGAGGGGAAAPMGPPPGAMPPPTMVPPPKPPGIIAAPPGGPGAMPPPGPMRKDGGRVDSSIKMRYGAGNEKGRMEKIEKYGKNAKA